MGFFTVHFEQTGTATGLNLGFKFKVDSIVKNTKYLDQKKIYEI